MVTGAIHIKLVESMDTASFINALQRFISRRGRPNTIMPVDQTSKVLSKN